MRKVTTIFSGADVAALVGSMAAAVASVAGVVITTRTRKENTDQHGISRAMSEKAHAKLSEVVEGQHEIKADVTDLKIEVADVKTDVRILKQEVKPAPTGGRKPRTVSGRSNHSAG
jgi:hypothetical protein